MLKMQRFARDKLARAVVCGVQSAPLLQQPQRCFGAMDQINFD